MNTGKATKAESGSGGKPTSQRSQTSTEQRSREAQRLRVGVGQQASLPKQGRWWILELVSWDRGHYSKLNCPTLLGKEPTKQSCSCRARQLLPGEKNQLWPPCANWQWVTSAPNCNLPCGQKEPNTTQKPSACWDHIRAPICIPVPGLDAKGVTPEHLPNRLNI
jgi:hypothetical protein